MAKFKYTAISPDGSTVSGVEEGLTPGVVRNALLMRDLTPTKIREKTSILQLEITKEKVPRKELMHFSRQLGVFIRAGIPILDALATITVEMEDDAFKKILQLVHEDLQSGATFADAVALHPQAFPPFYIGVLRSAELTGDLDTVLDQLADYIDRDLTAKSEVRQALIYPAIVGVLSIVVAVVLTVFVIPRFQTFFESLDAELPLATRILLAVSRFISNWGWLVGLVIGLLLLFLLVGLRTEWGKGVRDRVLLRLPLLGDVVQHAVLERFCRILSSMSRAGVPLPEALAVTSDATNNRVYQAKLVVAREAMLRGEGLAQPLAATGLFPSAARQMFAVGEDTGTLDKQLEIAAEYYERELGYKLKRFTALFEPAIIIFMGLVVGFVAVAMVSAMYGVFQGSENL